MITMVAPVGVARRYDSIRPSTKVMAEITTPLTITLRKLLKTVEAESTGKIMRAEISRAPISLIPRTTTTEHSIANTIL